MKTVTNAFKEEITKLGREIDFKFFLHTNDKILTEDGKFLMTEDNRHLVVEQFDETEVDEVINAEDIYNVSIINKGNILSTMMKELDFEISEDLRIGDVIGCQFGLKVDGSYEYIDYGKYMVYEKEFNEDTKTYSYVAYDRMLLTMQEANQEFLDDLEGRTLASAINVTCGKVGLSYNATEQELEDYPNLSNEINEGTFTDMQITYRDVLDMIAQALGLSMIVEEKILKLKPLVDNSSQHVSYELDGNTIQDGTPTPENPVEIQNVTGLIMKNEHPINLGDIELCKIGEYQDKIYKQNNKWYLHKEIGKIILNGSENWEKRNNGDGNTTITFQMYMSFGAFGTNSEYCNNFTYEQGSSSGNEGIGIASELASFYIQIKRSRLSSLDVAGFKNWLSTHNTTLYYVLASSTTEEITDATLISQLNNAGIVYTIIDEQYLKDTNVSFGEKYMINSVVLSRSEDNDNIYRRDEESIAENGVHEYKIKDNLIMLYDDREDYIDEIFEQLNGLEYYINDYSSTGITYLDWLDFYNVQIGNKTYKCLMLNDEIKIDQGLEEEIYSEMPEETVTPYKTSAKTDKEVSFIVDKQNGSIKAKVNKGEVINEINLDETGASINASKISLAGKTIEMTSDNIAINSTNFKVDKDGNMTANSGTFSGSINTGQNCTVGNNLYVGQNQSTSINDNKYIKMSDGTYMRRYRYDNLYELLTIKSGSVNIETTADGGIVAFESDTYNTSIATIGSWLALHNGYIEASHNIDVVSDKRKKQKIKDIDTSWIDELKVKEFEYIKTPNKKQIGLIAQDYENKDYAKYFLNKNENGYYSITYGNITNALIQYCQEMKKEINSLKEEIKQLKESDK